MGMDAIFHLLSPTDNPVLPTATAMRLALHGVWAILLGSATMLITRRLAWSHRSGLACLMMLWTLLPGHASPAYWLGLAFQTPSLMSAVICLGGAVNLIRREPELGVWRAGSRVAGLQILVPFGVVLGWLFLLDTLAWFPVSVYAWGFSAVAVAVVAFLATLLWVVSGTLVSAAPLIVLTLFVLSRLPTGNLWDALLDPWLWVALHWVWLVSALRRLKQRRLSATTRA